MNRLLRNTLVTLIISTALVIFSIPSFAAEIYMNNGDRITGTIVSETGSALTLESDAFGEITVQRAFVKNIKTDTMLDEAKQLAQKKMEEEITWDRTIAVGYSRTEGNTVDNEGSIELDINRKTYNDEWTFKAHGMTSSEDYDIDEQKFYGLLRYAYSFSNDRGAPQRGDTPPSSTNLLTSKEGRDHQRGKWYNFYKFEGGRDRSANVDYRLTPAVGVGYWWSDEAPFKLLGELAVGFEHTTFRGDEDETNEAVLVPRLFFEKTLLETLILTQDITFYPTLTDFGESRFFSKTDFTHPITDRLSWQLSVIDEYNSNPPEDTKENDFRLQSGIVYNF